MEYTSTKENPIIGIIMLISVIISFMIVFKLDKRHSFLWKCFMAECLYCSVGLLIMIVIFIFQYIFEYFSIILVLFILCSPIIMFIKFMSDNENQNKKNSTTNIHTTNQPITKSNNIPSNTITPSVINTAKYTQPRRKSYSYTTSSSKFDEFNVESYLHSLGYKVGKTGLSQYKRQELLKNAVSEGVITKQDIIDTLERNISMFKNRKNFEYAIMDWEEDLEYVKYEL